MQNYKDLKVWERSHQFTLMVYEKTGKYPKSETYCLTSQLRPAASSIPANIAEGVEEHKMILPASSISHWALRMKQNIF